MSIHPTAIIDPSAEIGENVTIADRVVIEAGVKIGNGVKIHSHVVIYPQVKIGDRSIIYSKSTIHERTIMGKDCIIYHGAVIGAEGFGFVPTRTGWYKMQQSGFVVLEDQVKVGCNSTIDRPAVGETRIGKNSQLDNLVHIGHNGKLGENCQFYPQVGLAGGIKVGNNVTLGMQVGIANQANISDGVIAALKAGIHSQVLKKTTLYGHPAVPEETWFQIAEILPKLKDLYRQFKQNQKKF